MQLSKSTLFDRYRTLIFWLFILSTNVSRNGEVSEQSDIFLSLSYHASWLLIKHLTNAENTAKWAIDTGYLPVRNSGYTSDVYQNFLAIATKEEPSLSELDSLVESISANAAYASIDFNDYDPAFAGIGQISSAKVREEAGYAMEAVYVGTKTVEEAIAEMLSQLTW